MIRIGLICLMFLAGTACASATLMMQGTGASASSAGMLSPIIGGGAGLSFPSNSAVDYSWLTGGYNAGWATSSPPHRQPIGLAGTVFNFTAQLPAALTAGSYQYLLTGPNGTVVSCTISNPAQSCYSATAGSITGSSFNIWESSPSSTPLPTITGAPGPLLTATFQASAGVQQQPIFFGGFTNLTATGSGQYMGPGGDAPANATEANVSGIFPVAGQIMGLTANPSATTSPGSFACTVYHNGSATSMTVTINSATIQQTTTNTFSVAALDTVSVKCVPSSSPASIAIGITLLWQPTIPGQAIVFSQGETTLPSISANNYENFTGATIATTTQSYVQNLTPVPPNTHTVSNFVTAIGTSSLPSGGMSAEVLDGSTNEMSCSYSTSFTIGTGAVTGCQDKTRTFSPAAGDVLSIETLPSGTGGTTPTWWKASAVWVEQ